MTAFAFYLLKLIACSGIFYAYYLLALRDRVFHQWNRFYLLSSILISLVAPLIRITIHQQVQSESGGAIQLLQVVQSADNYLDEITSQSQAVESTGQLVLMAYGVVSLVFLCLLIFSLIRLLLIIRSHVIHRIRNIRFINTGIPGTPFSFFHFIFWNEAIDPDSETGQHIFRHELVHVSEGHSVDKIFLQLVLAVFWCNPFFWLIRKELKLVHEFLADKKAVAEGGASVFAAVVLQTAYPGRFNALTNQFFQTSIKRRLAMLSKMQHPGLNYFSRILALPVIALTILAFTVKTKKSANAFSGPDKEITVVIDPGHGSENGKHEGAVSGDQYEADIVLSIARKINEMNANPQIRILLTRNTDAIVDLRQRVGIAAAQHADLFISLHTNATASSTASDNGIHVFVPGRNPAFEKASAAFGSILVSELNRVYATSEQLEVKKTGVFVLNGSPCPAVMIECGNISNQSDLQFISSKENQELVAEKILSAIGIYASRRQEPETSYRIDTLPREPKDKTREYISGELTVTNVSAEQAGTMKVPILIDNKPFAGSWAQLPVSGKQIRSISFATGSLLVREFGEKARSGMLFIATKKDHSPNRDLLRIR
jgi:N-acetylmuramoyl-L-alanine amidase